MSTGGPGGQYRIDIVWTSHGGQALATMGQIQSGMRSVGGAGLREGRNLGVFNRQMQAIGTTMRYFFAGGAIFGTMSAFQQFADFQGKLGNLAALAPEIRANLSDLGSGFLKTSTAIATPVGEIEDSARNILSTLQLTGSEMDEFLPKFTTLFSQGAKIAETDAYNFGNAVLGMNNAFSRSMGEMENTAGQFFTVIQRSAGMTGDEWAKFSGRVVAGAGMAGASLEEMNALMILGTRQGATAATNARHMNQFLMQLRNPTKESQAAWTEIGLTPEKLQTLPFAKIMDTLVNAVRKAGGLKRGKKMPEESILALEEAGMLDRLGDQEGGGPQLLTDLFGRMESRRMAGVTISEILAGERPGRPSYKNLLKELSDVEAQNKKIDEGFERWLDRNRIQQAGQAIRNMITESLMPAEDQIKSIAEKITELADPRVVQAAAGGILAYGAFKGFRGMGRFLRGAGTAGLALNQGGAPPTGSFANPFWVVIHPLSNVPGLGGGLGGRGGGRGRIPGGDMRGGGRGIPPIPIGGLAVAGSVALAMPSAEAQSDAEVAREPNLAMIRANPKRFPLAASLLRRAEHDTESIRSSMNQSTVLNLLLSGKATAKQAENMLLGNVLNAARGSQERMSSFSAVEDSRVGLFVDVSDDAKKLLKITATGDPRTRVHVPTGHTAWQGGATPQFRGNNRVYRGPH